MLQVSLDGQLSSGTEFSYEDAVEFNNFLMGVHAIVKKDDAFKRSMKLLGKPQTWHLASLPPAQNGQLTVGAIFLRAKTSAVGKFCVFAVMAVARMFRMTDKEAIASRMTELVPARAATAAKMSRGVWIHTDVEGSINRARELLQSPAPDAPAGPPAPPAPSAGPSAAAAKKRARQPVSGAETNKRPRPTLPWGLSWIRLPGQLRADGVHYASRSLPDATARELEEIVRGRPATWIVPVRARHLAPDLDGGDFVLMTKPGWRVVKIYAILPETPAEAAPMAAAVAAARYPGFGMMAAEVTDLKFRATWFLPGMDELPGGVKEARFVTAAPMGMDEIDMLQTIESPVCAIHVSVDLPKGRVGEAPRFSTVVYSLPSGVARPETAEDEAVVPARQLTHLAEHGRNWYCTVRGTTVVAARDMEVPGEVEGEPVHRWKSPFPWTPRVRGDARVNLVRSTFLPDEDAWLHLEYDVLVEDTPEPSEVPCDSDDSDSEDMEAYVTEETFTRNQPLPVVTFDVPRA